MKTTCPAALLMLAGTVAITGPSRSAAPPRPAKAPAANSNESPGRNGVTTSPVSQKTMRNKSP